MIVSCLSARCMVRDNALLLLVVIVSGYILADLVTREIVRFYGF